MAIKAKRVAVIGAGPAGAIALDALVKEQAFDHIRVFERKDQVGGLWIYSPQLPPKIPSLSALIERQADVTVPLPSHYPAETPKSERINSHQYRFSDNGLHEDLHSNVPPEIMAYTQEPIPKTLSERSLALFGPDSPTRHHTVIKKHIEDIFTRGEHEKLIEFNTTVELAEKKGGEWVLTLRKERPGKATDYWWQEAFDAVVIASGHYYVPHIPNIPGLIKYDQRFPGRVLHTKHFRSADDFKGKRVVVVGGSISAIDAVHDIREVARKPIYAAIRNPLPAFGITPFEHPHIVIKKPVALFDPDTGRIYFEDSSFVDEVDHVVFASGYDFSFPFLPKLKIPNRRIPGLYLHVFNIEDPTLAFIGSVSGFTFKAFEYQAVATARVLAGRASLPPPSTMRKWEADHLALRGEGKPFYTLAPDFEQYFEALRAVAGEPAPGTTGRVLPPFDPAWSDIFANVLETRLNHWRREAKRVEEEEKAQKEVVKARL